MNPATLALPRNARLAARRARVLRERLIELTLFLAALVSVFTTVGIVYILVKESVVFFQQVPLADFLTDRQWTPLFDDAHWVSVRNFVIGTCSKNSTDSLTRM